MTEKSYYISSGAKNAMRTLRCVVTGKGVYADNYVCNLARDYDAAIEKARRLVGDSAKLTYVPFELVGWGENSKSAREKQQMHLLMNERRIPIGKHKGALLEELDEGYIKFWVMKMEATTRVATAVVRELTNLANDNDLFVKWETEAAEAEAAFIAKIQAMNYVGEVGKRDEFFLRCDRVLSFDSAYGTLTMNVCADRDGNEVVYRGTNAWEEGLYYVVDATVKTHKCYKDGRPQTFISRPRIKKTIRPEV